MGGLGDNDRPVWFTTCAELLRWGVGECGGRGWADTATATDQHGLPAVRIFCVGVWVSMGGGAGVGGSGGGGGGGGGGGVWVWWWGWWW